MLQSLFLRSGRKYQLISPLDRYALVSEVRGVARRKLCPQCAPANRRSKQRNLEKVPNKKLYQEVTMVPRGGIEPPTP
jgi:hypothetical protein